MSFSLEEIRISTERLLIRCTELEDAEDILEIRGDPDTAEAAGVPRMNNLEDAENYINNPAGIDDSFSILLNDEVIGLVEMYSDEELLSSSKFIGYYMKKSHMGKGYMTEALMALKDKLFEEGIPEIMLWMFPDNEASRRVALKCGWSYLGNRLVDIGGFNQIVFFFGQKRGN